MKQKSVLLVLLGLASAGGYVGLAAARGSVGFPVDDAWIHQVYGRNLAWRGEFAFFPGEPSAGSTSPFWTVLLALGYSLSLDARAWASIVGAVLLCSGALSARTIAARLADRIAPHLARSWVVWLPVAFVLEWHLSWGAVSGMEILLFVFLSLLLFERFLAGAGGWSLGVISGMLTLTRPEGAVLAAMIGGGVLVKSLFAARPGGAKWGTTVGFCAGATILLAPYLLFNGFTSGTPFPNTFYAKAAEYAVLFERSPLPARWIELAAVPWVGAQILLLPGFVFITAQLVRRWSWELLIPVVWSVAQPGLYALRLPVAYQHGRYEMPIIPVILVYGMVGTGALLRRIRWRVLRRTLVLSLAVLFIAFWLVGGGAFSSDVAIIECEMVDTARWFAANAPADALVAAHDIGALGYYYPRSFIDLAGLVTPEIIPIMRDQERLTKYLVERGATHAIFFPDWYPILALDGRFKLLRQGNCSATREAGGTPLTVYEISPQP